MTKNQQDNASMPSVWNSFVVGAAEATILHPLSTLNKMYHMRPEGKSVFGEARTFSEKIRMTCRGIQYAGPNKVISRVVTMGFQPLIKDRIAGQFDEVSAHVIAGVVPSLASTLLTMPLDTLKARRQTGSSTRQVGELLRSSARSFTPTVTRNLIGMSSLFGGAAWARQLMSHRSGGAPVTKGQDMAACLAGGVLGAVLSNPMDVIKTQTQATGKEVVKVACELGLRGMGRGLGPNMLKGLQRGMIYWMTRQGTAEVPRQDKEPARRAKP